MKKSYSIFIFLFFCTSLLCAQDSLEPCGTHQGRSTWLKKYQAQPNSYAKGGDTTLYIAMSIHLVAADNGIGYFSINGLMKAFCKLNEVYASFGIQFYQAGDIHYIANSAYNSHQTIIDGAEMMFANNVPNTLNVYFVNDPAGNCGYNLPYAGIANAKSCSGANDITWAHEVGHALNLPHPFYGWEDDGYLAEDETHNYSDPAPITVLTDDYTVFKDTLILDTLIIDTIFVEKVDGSNCTFAADGFCDTAPDYLSNRWSCNNNGVSGTLQHDPDNVAFRSDGSLVMNYANDACQNRFTDEQISAMRAFLMDEHPEWIVPTDQFLPPVEETAVTIAPLDGEDVIGYGAELSWEAVDNATHYVVYVSRLASFPTGLTSEFITSDLSVTTEELTDDKTYFWKVLAFNPFQFCASFSSNQSFIIHHPETAVHDISGLKKLSLFPQPLSQGQSLNLVLEMDNSWSGNLGIKNQIGQIIDSRTITLNAGLNTLQLDFPSIHSGLYFLNITNGKETLSRKLIIH